MTSSLRSLRFFPALLVLLALLQPRPAAAGFDAVINAWAGNVTDFLEELIEPLTGPIVQSASPLRPATVDDNDRLWRYLSDAGYEIASVETDISLIPKATVTLQLVRELSEADRTYLERALLIDNQREPGINAALKRQIVHSLLEASQSGEMRVSKLTIGFFPLPAAEFTMTPAEGRFSAQNALNNQGGGSKPGKNKPASEPPEPRKAPAKTVGE